MISELTIVFLALALVVGRPAPTGRMPIAGHGAGPSEPAQHRPRDGPATTDHNRCASDIALFAACVTAGLPPALAAATVADTYQFAASPWHTTAALLALGANPERAWSELRTLPGGRGPGRPCHLVQRVRRRACQRLHAHRRTSPIHLRRRRNGESGTRRSAHRHPFDGVFPPGVLRPRSGTSGDQPGRRHAQLTL